MIESFSENDCDMKLIMTEIALEIIVSVPCNLEGTFLGRGPGWAKRDRQHTGELCVTTPIRNKSSFMEVLNSIQVGQW